jgi:two-component system cell cycle response regulator
MKILIQDSNSTSRQSLASMLLRMGHDVCVISEPLQECESFSSKCEAQIALVDHAIAGAACAEIFRQIRKTCGANLYIILLTEPNSAEAITTELESAVDDLLLRPFTEAELRTHIRTATRVLELQNGRIKTQRLLLNAAMSDDLTGLWNRRMILNQLARELNRARHECQPLAVAMVDIDLFKTVNDTHGHLAGDTVLRDVALSLRSQLRSYDFIGRYGGEEFLALLPGCDSETSTEIARRMCNAVAGHTLQIGNVEVPVTVSIGLSSTAEVGFEPEALIAAADSSLYRAKAGGRNQVIAGFHGLDLPRTASRSR